MYLSDNQIIKIIFEYIDDPLFRQAIMIDGEWGSGKTYFIKNVLIPKLNENYNKTEKGIVAERNVSHIIYITLYGLDECSQIYESINSEIMKNKISKLGVNGDKVLASLSFASKIISYGASHFGMNSEELPSINDFINMDKCLFVFDDLERCNIEINQLFGFINNLVEHNNIKVLIVANQKEIGKLVLAKDLPRKYEVALNQHLQFGDVDNSEKEEKKSLISVNDLNKRVEELFLKRTLYEDIKEKLIGVIIKYTTSLENVTSKILNENFKDKEVGNVFNDNYDLIIRVMKKYKCNNLRTLVFALSSFEKLSSAFPVDLEDKFGLLKKEYVLFLEYTLSIAIQIKSVAPLYNWDKASKNYGFIYLSGDFYKGDKLFGYKFVDDFLLYRYFDSDEIRFTLISIIEEKVNEHLELLKMSKRNEVINSLSYNKIREWHKIDNLKNIYEGLEIMSEELRQNMYPSSYFKEIIILLLQLEHNGFEGIDIDKYVKLIRDNIVSDYSDIDKYKFDIFSSDIEFKRKYNSIISPIIEVLNSFEKEGKSTSWVLQNTDEWGKKFTEYCNINKDSMLSNKAFLSNFDILKLAELLKTSSLNNLYDFLYNLDFVYSFSNLNDFYKADIDSIVYIVNDLNTHLEDYTNESITRKVYFKLLEEKLSEALIKIQR